MDSHKAEDGVLFFQDPNLWGTVYFEKEKGTTEAF
jgi:hypothetical protein